MFAVVGSLYFLLGKTLLREGLIQAVVVETVQKVELVSQNVVLFDDAILAVSFFFFHIATYGLLAYKRENNGSIITRKMVIGVDIDGVLNNHREIFCSMFNNKFAANIDPNDITHIPVHKCSGLGIAKEQEIEIFNDPSYWSDMTAMTDAAEVLRKIKMSQDMKVWAFTHRPWPNLSQMDSTERFEKLKQWDERISIYSNLYLPHCIVETLIIKCSSLVKFFQLGGLFKRRGCHARLLTKRWLDVNDFPIDKLFIETKRDEVFSRHKPTHNRISKAELNPHVQFFVEDDPVNAIKLSDHCELVFLIDHPYNQSIDQYGELKVHEPTMPKNVIRVRSWHEIKSVLDGFL